MCSQCVSFYEWHREKKDAANWKWNNCLTDNLTSKTKAEVGQNKTSSFWLCKAVLLHPLHSALWVVIRSVSVIGQRHFFVRLDLIIQQWGMCQMRWCVFIFICFLFCCYLFLFVSCVWTALFTTTQHFTQFACLNIDSVAQAQHLYRCESRSCLLATVVSLYKYVWASFACCCGALLWVSDCVIMRKLQFSW